MSLTFSLFFLAGCSATTSGLSINNASGVSEEIPFKLLKPDGAGPFAAVVIMHDCSGLGPRSSGAPERWAKELLKRGYAVISGFSPPGDMPLACAPIPRPLGQT